MLKKWKYHVDPTHKRKKKAVKKKYGDKKKFIKRYKKEKNIWKFEHQMLHIRIQAIKRILSKKYRYHKNKKI